MSLNPLPALTVDLATSRMTQEAPPATLVLLASTPTKHMVAQDALCVLLGNSRTPVEQEAALIATSLVTTTKPALQLACIALLDSIALVYLHVSVVLPGFLATSVVSTPTSAALVVLTESTVAAQEPLHAQTVRLDDIYRRWHKQFVGSATVQSIKTSLAAHAANSASMAHSVPKRRAHALLVPRHPSVSRLEVARINASVAILEDMPTIPVDQNVFHVLLDHSLTPMATANVNLVLPANTRTAMATMNV